MKGYSTGSPALIFMFSDEELPAPKKAKNYDPQPSRQAKESGAAWAELFQSEGDYSVFIPGRFFNIYRADATTIKAHQNKYLCSEKAPLVILVDKAGKIVDIMDGRAAVKRPKVVYEMTDVLRKDGYIQNGNSFGRLQELMASLEKVEVNVMAIKSQVSEAASKFASAQSTKAAQKKGDLTSSGKAAKEKLGKVEADLKEQETARYKILSEEYTLLKELGMPPAKLPPEPRQPN